MERHHHKHESAKAVVNRISRAVGHLESIKRMVEEERDCSEILVQLSAVRAAINGIGRVVLKDHIDHCVVDAAKRGDAAALTRLNDAIATFLK